MNEDLILPEQKQEPLPTTPGFHTVDIPTQYEELYLIDKQIADGSNGLILPMWSANELKEFLFDEHKSTTLLLNDELGNHTGSFSYYYIDENTSELLNIGVLSEFQGKGYAQQMMQKYFELNPNKNTFVLVTKPDNFQAIRFYEKSGYKIKELKKDYYGPGEDRVFLELKK